MAKRILIAGIDEAGRGPWAGPVVAACVVLCRGFDRKILKDSKVLSATQRYRAYRKIIKQCSYGIGVVENTYIDRHGLLPATQQAMLQAFSALPEQPTLLKVDGRDKFQFPIPHVSIIKGDAKVAAISAASIVAKVWRDKLMKGYHQQYRSYGFNRHKGYGTARHQKALKKHGVCAIHRLSYKPVHLILNEQLS